VNTKIATIREERIREAGDFPRWTASMRKIPQGIRETLREAISP